MKTRNPSPLIFLSLMLLATTNLSAQIPKWTDNSGKYKVEAEFIRLEGGQVHLRKPDGKEITVPLSRLSSASQEQVRRLEKEQGIAKEPPLPQVSPDGMPPELPAMPPGGEWETHTKATLDQAITGYNSNQVTAYFTFREIHDRKTNGPTAMQKEWLERAAAVCRPRALAVVTADYVRAGEKGDLRTALVASLVASKIHAIGVGDKGTSLAALKARAFSSDPPAESTWKLDAVSASELVGAYSEGNGFAGNQITITPKTGYRLVRVKAKVTNIGNQSDPPYVKWAFGGLKSALVDANSADEAKSDKPQRLAMDEFIFLVTGGGDWISCGHVCETSPMLRVFSATIQNSNVGLIAVGGYVKQGDSFDMDVLFTVPKGIDEARLLVLGAQPTLLKFPSR